MSCTKFPLVKLEFDLILSFNGLLEEQTVLEEVSSAGKVKQFYWCSPTFSNLLS